MSDLVERLRVEGAYMHPGAHLLHEAANEIERKDAAISELVAALKEARGMVLDWASYADNYFRDKWDLAGDLAKLDAAVAKAESS